jgi:hypothetical protein
MNSWIVLFGVFEREEWKSTKNWQVFESSQVSCIPPVLSPSLSRSFFAFISPTHLTYSELIRAICSISLCFSCFAFSSQNGCDRIAEKDIIFQSLSFLMIASVLFVTS